jgi:protein TonB
MKDRGQRMFEDSTFESTGRIRTRSRGWMLATLVLNSSILLVLILIPLVYPEALPHQVLSLLLTAPPPPPPPAPPQEQRPTQAFHGVPQMDEGTLVAPSQIPSGIKKFAGPEESAVPGNLNLEGVPGATFVPGDAFRGQKTVTVAPPAKQGPVRVSSSVVAGMLLRKTLPVYPPIAVAARVEGVVVLQATISKAGTIENLRVISGPAMLQQAALDAVREWRYRPYLLNGEPVEVETTVNVIFTRSQ